MIVKADILLFVLSLIAIVGGVACYLYGMYANSAFFLLTSIGYSAYTVKNYKEKHIGH